MLRLFQYRSWALAEDYFSRMFPALMNRSEAIERSIRKPTSEELLANITGLAGIDADVEFKMEWDDAAELVVAKASGKRIALTSLIGPITKYGDLCSYGTQHYQGMIDRMNRSSNIDGMVLVMDSPGGTVDGTPELALAVKQSKKPIGVFGDGMVASAALWIASQARVIVGNRNNPTEFGSIGVLVVSDNWQNMMEAGQYPKVEIIRAPQSNQKALFNSIEPVSDEVRAQILAELKDICNEFISVVKSGRGSQLNTKLEGLFAGKMFDVNIAKQNGLIDHAGTLATAINKVAELARQQSKEGTNVQTNTSAQMKFPKLSALFGFGKSKDAKEVSLKGSSDEGLTSEDNASLEAAEKKVADMEAENAQLRADNQAKADQITKLDATVSEHKTQITKLEEEKKALQSKLDEKPQGQLTTVVPDENKEAKTASESESGKKNQYATSIDAQAAEIRKTNASNSQYK